MNNLTPQNQAQANGYTDPYEASIKAPAESSLIGKVIGVVVGAAAAVFTYGKALTRTFGRNIADGYIHAEGPLKHAFDGKKIPRKLKPLMDPLRSAWNSIQEAQPFKDTVAEWRTTKAGIGAKIASAQEMGKEGLPLWKPWKWRQRYSNWRHCRQEGQHLFDRQDRIFGVKVGEMLETANETVKKNKPNYITDDQKVGIIALSVAAAVVVGYGAKKIIDKLSQHSKDEQEAQREARWQKRIQQQEAVLMEQSSQSRY